MTPQQQLQSGNRILQEALDGVKARWQMGSPDFEEHFAASGGLELSVTLSDMTDWPIFALVKEDGSAVNYYIGSPEFGFVDIMGLHSEDDLVQHCLAEKLEFRHVIDEEAESRIGDPDDLKVNWPLVAETATTIVDVIDLVEKRSLNLVQVKNALKPIVN